MSVTNFKLAFLSFSSLHNRKSVLVAISFFVLVFLVLPNVYCQQINDPRTWFKGDQTWIKIATDRNLIYQLDIADLLSQSFPENLVPAEQVKMYKNGVEIPIEIKKNTAGLLQSGDKIRFYGNRNDGTGEKWAYGNAGADQASTYYSLFSDTTYFWLTWSDAPSKRYQNKANALSGTFYTGFRDTVYNEADASSYYRGYETGAELATYGESEGFYWYDLDLANKTSSPVTFSGSINDIIKVDSTIYFQARMASQSVGLRTIRTELLHSQNGSIAYHDIGSYTWSGKGGGIVNGEVSPIKLIDYSKMDFIFRVLNLNTGSSFSNPHLMLFDWYKYSFYRGFTFGTTTLQTTFWLKPDGIKSVEFKNIEATNSIKVYSPTKGITFETVKDDVLKTASFYDETSSNQNELYVFVKDESYPQPLRIAKSNVTSSILDAINEAEFIVLTRPMFKAQAQIYANYRASKSGKITKVVLADDIWELFGYGSQTPKAIQDFVHYARKTWQKAPEYMFILADANLQFRNTVVTNNQIPSFGYPSSDYWYGMNQDGLNDWIPRLSIGRLTVINPSEIIAYLSKVSQYEGSRSEYEAWQKKVTLLSGGLEASEREVLLEHNLRLASVASNSVIAADTIIIGKKSNQPLDASSRGDLSSIINNGTFLLQFFGHSAPDSWDLLTDNPQNFQNQGKLSVVLSLGCYSGLFTEASNRVIAEQFVFAPNAAIAFIGGSGQGHPSALQNYSEHFFQKVFNDTLRILGDVDLQTKVGMIRQYLNITMVDLALVLNTNIIGDPSLRLAYPIKPDYRFDFNPISFSPNPTNISDSTVQVSATIRNFGTLAQQNSSVTIEHIRPLAAPEEYSITLEPVRTIKTVSYPVKLRNNDAGLHRFSFVIDQEQALQENDVNNNRFESEHMVFSTGADLIYPIKNSIHNSKTPLFVASSPTIFKGDFMDMELDSLGDFQNPIASTSIQGTNLNVQWIPDLLLKQGKKYFWRAKVNKPGETNWKTASFLVDTTVSGTWWEQQTENFSENRLSSSLLLNDGVFGFNNVNLELRTSTLPWSLANISNSIYSNYPASTYVNGEQMGRLSISFFMLVINGLTGEIRNGIDAQGIPKGQRYNVHAGQYWSPTDGALSRNQFIADLKAVRAGDYVMLRVRQHALVSPTSAFFSGDTDPLLSALRSVGGFKATGGVDGKQSYEISSSSGYILFGKKFASQSQYDPSQVSEYIVSDRVLEADTVLQFNTSEGSMTTELIGPAKKWNKFEGSANRVSATGKVFVDVFGQANPTSAPIRLITVNPTGLLSTFNSSLASIDANQYPFIRLVARLENVDRKAPQLNSWRVSFDPVSEMAIDPFSAVALKDSVEEGYVYNFSIKAQNLGLTNTDSVRIEFIDVFKPTNGQIEATLIKSETLKGFESFRKSTLPAPVTTIGTSVVVPTVNKQGNHTLQVRFGSEFVDQFAYNNYYSRDFYVQKDSISPKIEVFIDNRFLPPVKTPIVNKENPSLSYVAAKPKIDIYWKDTNPYLRLQDSSMIEIRVFSSEPNQYTSYTASSPEIRFVPASISGNRNEAYVEFMPDFSAYSDTALTLQVFSRDKTGNVAENKADGYMVSFRVTNSEGMTSFYPYPNPMSNFTNFAFELQGQDIKSIERLKMKIFTLTGRPVKVIDIYNNQFLLNDGQLRIGWNVFRWDGRDDDGDPLATGVYLYHIDFKAGGKTITVNNKNSVEKIVIIR